ncbi:hypothetical protein [Roseovarius sp. MBR-154]|jgi:hypothetical protein
MSRSKSLGIALSLMLGAGSSHAADFSDPTWPCIQRKVPTLSVGLMWTHSLPDAPETDPDLKREIDRLAAKLALRRLEVERLRADIEAFAARHDGAPDMLGHVFQRVFTTLSTRRAQVISGIEEFSLSQIALSERIDTARAEMTRLTDAENPDFDRMDALEEQLDWDQLIYTDRQSTITYLCETPTLIEKRLYSIAQILQQQINEPG